jgi:hypothetical protein
LFRLVRICAERLLNSSVFVSVRMLETTVARRQHGAVSQKAVIFASFDKTLCSTVLQRIVRPFQFPFARMSRLLSIAV